MQEIMTKLSELNYEAPVMTELTEVKGVMGGLSQLQVDYQKDLTSSDVAEYEVVESEVDNYEEY